MEEIINVKGMVCGGCEKRVENALMQIDGVIDVKADHNTGKVIIKTEKEIDKTVVLKTFNENTLKYFANPNSTHDLGKEANQEIVNATNSIMEMFQKETKISEDSEITYTSGSSESNNLAIKGIANSYKENGKHIVSTFF